MAHCYIAILLLTVKLFHKTYGVGYVNLAIFEQYTPDYVPCMHVRIDLAAKRNGSYDGMDRLFCVYHQEYELCYCFDKIPDREDSFQTAQQNCIDIDGQLAVIDTKDKLLVLSSIMFTLYLNGEFYIGLERMGGEWTWLEEEGYRAAEHLEFLDENIGDKYGIIIKTDTDCPLEIECDEIHFWPQFEKKKRKKRTAEVDAAPFDYDKLVSLVESHEEYDYKQYSQDSGDFEGGYSGYDLYGDWELPTDIFGSAGFGTTDGSWNGNISDNFRYICTTKPDHEYAAAYKDAFYANWYATYGYYEGYGKYYVPPEYDDDGYEDETQVEQKFVSYGYRGYGGPDFVPLEEDKKSAKDGRDTLDEDNSGSAVRVLNWSFVVLILLVFY